MSGLTATRPLGITIIAALALIAGVLGIIAGVAVLGLGGGLGTVSGTITLLIAVAELGLAYGLWMLLPWSWRLCFALAIVNPLWELGRFLFRGADPLSLVVGVLFAAVWIYYLNLPGIRAALHAPASGFPLIGNALDGVLGGQK